MPGRGRATVLLIKIILGQRPIVLAVGAGGGISVFFSRLSFLLFSPYLWYRLKHCVKGPINLKKQQQQFGSRSTVKEKWVGIVPPGGFAFVIITMFSVFLGIEKHFWQRNLCQ